LGCASTTGQALVKDADKRGEGIKGRDRELDFAANGPLQSAEIRQGKRIEDSDLYRWSSPAIWLCRQKRTWMRAGIYASSGWGSVGTGAGGARVGIWDPWFGRIHVLFQETEFSIAPSDGDFYSPWYVYGRAVFMDTAYGRYGYGGHNYHHFHRHGTCTTGGPGKPTTAAGPELFRVGILPRTGIGGTRLFQFRAPGTTGRIARLLEAHVEVDLKAADSTGGGGILAEGGFHGAGGAHAHGH